MPLPRATALMAPLSPLAEAGRGVLDLVLPPRCLACGVQVTAPGTLCGPCFSGLTFLTPPLCPLCGLSLPEAGGAEALPEPGPCPACRTHPPRIDSARASLLYDEGCQPLILAFKHADRTEAAPAFARWMARAGRSLLAGEPLLVPVPLHPRRLAARRYNQAALLAREIARTEGLETAPLALARLRPTPSQGHKGRAARRANVRGAFALAQPDRVAGRRVVLIDDVLTTGATVEECAHVLRHAGAAGVGVLTLARVPPDPPDPLPGSPAEVFGAL